MKIRKTKKKKKKKKKKLKKKNLCKTINFFPLSFSFHAEKRQPKLQTSKYE